MAFIRRWFLGVAAALGLSGPALAVELTMSSWVGPTHTLMADFFIPWAAELDRASNGRIKVNLLPKPVANAPGHLDAVRDGLVDLSFIAHSYYPGRFNLAKFAQMPFGGDSAEARSVAAWRIYQKHFLKADEHKGVNVLAVYAHGPAVILTASKPVTEAASLSGMKIRVGGSMALDIAKALDVNIIAKPAPEVYELMSNGVVDGAFFPAEAVVSFKLDRIVKNVTTFPGGLYSDTHAVIINPDSFAKLPKADQDLLLKFSGEYMAHMAGKAWDKHDAIGMKLMRDNGTNIIKASDRFVAVVREKVGPIEAEWKAAAKAAGADPDAVLAEFQAELKKTSVTQ